MSENHDSQPSSEIPSQSSSRVPPKPLGRLQRRILGVLMEKARSTPDAYPLTLNSLVTGCNQKSNRHPLMDLQASDVESELERMRAAELVGEIQGSGRVPKYRHYGYDYLGVKGVEAAVMIELLLRGEQTAGELRSRAARFEPIADLATLMAILDSLAERGLVIALTPPGRGQVFSHNLYMPEELAKIKNQLAANPSSPVADSPHTSNSETRRPSAASAHPSARSTSYEASSAALVPDQVSKTNAGPVVSQSEFDRLSAQVEQLQEEVSDLRLAVEDLRDRLDRLEN